MQRSVIKGTNKEEKPYHLLIKVYFTNIASAPTTKRNIKLVNYRRNFLPGGMFFFTATLHNRKSTLLVDKIELLKEAIHMVKTEYPFQIRAYVVLPEHMHMIWQLPPRDSNYSLRWQKIKTRFSKAVCKTEMPVFKSQHNECILWQRRFWEHTIRDEKDFENHVHYIHYNPIKHGLVSSLHQWPHSSFHHYVRFGQLPYNWSGNGVENVNAFGFGE
ncbi:transposase [Legionella dresdenensis]|uniref:Transposase n=1 Tax=Legionella dresdenensis TaxID=450200 RepID=A0ABV8CF96_9GAMM